MSIPLVAHNALAPDARPCYLETPGPKRAGTSLGRALRPIGAADRFRLLAGAAASSAPQLTEQGFRGLFFLEIDA